MGSTSNASGQSTRNTKRPNGTQKAKTSIEVLSRDAIIGCLQFNALEGIRRRNVSSRRAKVNGTSEDHQVATEEDCQECLHELLCFVELFVV